MGVGAHCSVTVTRLINNGRESWLGPGGWPHGDRGLSHTWPSWQQDGSLLGKKKKKEKKCDTAFLRTELVSAKSQDADLRSGRVPAATRGQHLPGMRD